MKKTIFLLAVCLLVGNSALASVNSKTEGGVAESWVTLPEKTFFFSSEPYGYSENSTGMTRKFAVPGERTGRLVATVRKRSDQRGSRYGLEIVGCITFMVSKGAGEHPISANEIVEVLPIRLLIAEADLGLTLAELNKMLRLTNSSQSYQNEIGGNRFILYRTTPEGVMISAKYQGEIGFVGPDYQWQSEVRRQTSVAAFILPSLISCLDKAMASFEAAKKELDEF